MTDRIFITNMVDISETGMYAVGYQFAMVINMLCGSFNQAWVPWLYAKLKDGRDEVTIVKITYIYFVMVVIFALGLTWIAPLVMRFYVGESFSGAHRFVLWIAIGYAFNGMYKMLTTYIFFVQKTYILAWITFFTAIVNVAANYLFINYEGAIGAAKATALSFFISFVLTWILAAKVYKMPWSLKKLNE